MIPNNVNKNPKVKKRYTVIPKPADSETIGKICSICGTGIMNGESVVTCPECSLPYHHECWKEMGGCGSYGCLAAPEIKKADYGPSDVYVSGWTSEKKCPSCGSMILSNALVCKICGAKFPTEKPMTKHEYENRPYDGDELNSVRLKVIGQFLLSAIGILTIVMLFVNLAVILCDNFIVKKSRLSKELWLLTYLSAGISVIWAFAFLLLFFSQLIKL